MARVFTHAFDIRDSGQIESLINFVVDRDRTIDILINNSGLAVAETVEEISDEGWEKVLQTNLRGVMQLVRGVLPHMMKEDFGDIVNISSRRQARVCRRPIILRIKVRPARLLRGLARSCEKDESKYPGVQLLSRVSGCRKHRTVAVSTPRFYSRIKPVADIDLCTFTGSGCGARRYKYLLEVIPGENSDG